MIQTILRMIEPLQRRVMLMISRCLVSRVEDSKKMQELQITMLDGETAIVEHVQNYGFTANPVAGAEGISVSVGGNREHVVVIAVDDRRYRVKNLAAGEVAVYNNTGASVVLKADGSIELVPGASGTIRLGGALLTQAIPTETFAAVVCGYLATLTAAFPTPCPATPDLIPNGLTTKTEAL